MSPSVSVQNLGVTFDPDLFHHNHISKLCSTSFYHIRHLRQIRSSVDKNSAIILANALVSSRLDYCNSLFYGLPSTSIYRLQKNSKLNCSCCCSFCQTFPTHYTNPTHTSLAACRKAYNIQNCYNYFQNTTNTASIISF